MFRRAIEKNLNKKRNGMSARLGSQALGCLSGDQFCFYVASRCVITSLFLSNLPKFAGGELELDYLTKKYIQANLEYRYVVVDSSADAFELEGKARDGSPFN